MTRGAIFGVAAGPRRTQTRSVRGEAARWDTAPYQEWQNRAQIWWRIGGGTSDYAHYFGLYRVFSDYFALRWGRRGKSSKLTITKHPPSSKELWRTCQGSTKFQTSSERTKSGRSWRQNRRFVRLRPLVAICRGLSA